MKAVVLGGGESGFGAAALAKKQGYDVIISDNGAILEKYRRKIIQSNIAFEENGHTDQALDGAHIVIKSPGIPDTAPVVRLLRSRDIPVVSEIEFAGNFTGTAKTICVTGSNGKTTTASMIYHILNTAGFNVCLAGNVGNSFAYEVATGTYDWYVLEISSFQLDGMDKFKADTAVLLNITPDHLDRYEYDINKYAASKMGIIRNQQNDDYFIFNRDDDTIMDNINGYNLPMRILPFSLVPQSASDRLPGHDTTAWNGAYLDRDLIFARYGEKTFSIDTECLKIKGKHNYYNTMAAILASLSAGVSNEALREGLRSFTPIAHRLERVAELGGIEYINDSKATNPDSVWYALDGMTKPVVWIAGGTDKGNDYTQLEEVVKGRVKALICMGMDNKKLAGHFKGIVPVVEETSSMEEAMNKAAFHACAGDVILLSPACASFDLFRNYEDRGDQFRKWVVDRIKNK